MRSLKKFKTIFYLLLVSIIFAGLFHYESSKGTGFTERFSQHEDNREGQEYLVGREVEHIQGMRKSIMRDYCLTHNFEQNPPANADSLGYIFVDDKFQLIYCAIAKVASTTMKTIFAQLYNKSWREEDVHFWTLGKKGEMGLIPLHNYTEEQKAIRLKTYFKFLFVREPLHRLLSAFKDKFISNKTSLSRSARGKIVKTYRPRDYVSNGENVVTFPEFIKYYSKNRKRDHHWRQYEKICHPCLVKYDFIGKLETLSEDGPSLLKMAGLSDRVAFPPIHKHTSVDEVLKYYSNVPPGDIKQIGEQYFSDFAMFGYEFLGPVKLILKNS